MYIYMYMQIIYTHDLQKRQNILYIVMVTVTSMTTEAIYCVTYTSKNTRTHTHQEYTHSIIAHVSNASINASS